MDNLDDSENNAKISDSGYSNSCSNSQSRRSRSSKSTHSGSHSSGSSGYRGKPSISTSNSSTNLSLPPEIRCKEKDTKKSKQVLADKDEVATECSPPQLESVTEGVQEEIKDVAQTPCVSPDQSEKEVIDMDLSISESASSKDEVLRHAPTETQGDCKGISASHANNVDGFSCVVSMADGVVIYTTSSLTTSLGYPKKMWLGRSFIEFVHPRDRNTVASQITSGFSDPMETNGMEGKGKATSVATIVCRIRRYRDLTTGFGIVQRIVSFIPFLLKLSFKDMSTSSERDQSMFLVVQATPFITAFKTSNEIIDKAVPFVIRHAAIGNLEYLDPASVPYLGYMPQEIVDTNALKLYHPDDLTYLSKIYEMIVKEGGVSRCKAYRMLAQNGDYVKVETEWSSFINPWSRKLEFVIGTHHIVEGPTNVNVFDSPDQTKVLKQTDEEKENTQMLRDTIVRIMTEVLTKPAEVAMQQKKKRCLDVAAIMETLADKSPKTKNELRLEIFEPEYSYYERDSVLLGGISPHHENNDSKSSTETTLSYNQLNYSETLQRYFDSHLPYSAEDLNMVNDENMFQTKTEKNNTTSNCLAPVLQNPKASPSGTTNTSETSGVIVANNMEISKDNMSLRLTEALLNKHNFDMEKELVKHHREARPSSKGERVKESHDQRRKKREHLARCNAAFQPTMAGNALCGIRDKTHGVKRASKQVDSEAKHHCRTRRPQITTSTMNPPTFARPAPLASYRWPSAPSGMNAYFLGLGFPQQMTIMNPMSTMQGMIPMGYYQSVIPTTIENRTIESTSSTAQFQQSGVPFMMYGQPWSPFMYPNMNPPLNPSNPLPIQENVMVQAVQCTNDVFPLGLGSRNFEEACKPRVPVKVKSNSGVQWKDKKRADFQANFSKNMQDSPDSATSADVLNGSVEPIVNRTSSRGSKANTKLNTSEDNVDRTDGESSYSSFYSSFLKTDSGSAEDSGDAMRATIIHLNGSTANATNMYLEQTQNLSVPKKVPKRKMVPPWLEQVCVTSELIYKYQIVQKNEEEVLREHMKKLSALTQPSLVNEQLGQLYLDLQLEGVAARLTLEEGVTSSSSSEEENTKESNQGRKKQEYSKLVIIHEEDAPLPSPSDGEPAPCPPDENQFGAT